MTDTVTIIFEIVPMGMSYDIEIPLDITVKELKNALSQGFQFNWKTEYFLRMESSSDILEEDEILENYHFHDGTRLILDSNEQGFGENSKSINNDLWDDSFYEYPQYIKNVRQQYKMLSEAVEVLPPEAEEKEEEKSILLTIMPMLVSLMLTVVLRGVMGNGGTFVIYSVATMTMSGIITLINYRNDKLKRQEKRKKREELYLQYIIEKEALIQELQEKERVIANRKYTSVTEKIQFVKEFNNRLFEKRKQDEDFLEIRIGEGIVESGCEIKVRESEFKELNDPLAQCPSVLAQKYKYLDKMPVILNLKNINAVGIVGSRTKLYQLAKNLILSICIEHYYHDVKIFFIMEEKDAQFFSWTRWLQNMREKSSNIRNFMYDEQSAKVSLEFLYAELAQRESMNKALLEEVPHYVIFVYRSKKIAEHPVSEYISKGKELGFTFIFFENYEELLNENCEKRILLNPNSNEGYIQDVKDGEKIQYFHYPHVDKKDAEKAALRLACVYVDEVNLESALTKQITLYQMLGIKDVKEIDLKQNWSRSQVYDTMAVPIGVKNGGTIVSLDLHEKYHGPHGLVAGTTGSGKSEILQTFILSAAILFHPHEVSFVIIDFKGGGMVNQFKDLPHLTGAITNIDGREIDRSLKSIKAELLKRQALFAEANVNHIDRYIKLYKEGGVQIPLPHLIIIVDEFAELKAEQPEFMKELISAARIGRSLGVHLILATQKPSGQVNEQIWSNSKFKICLKVQTKGDSNEVLKSPLAAEIKEPGRAYLQVGNNEIFELLQSAYSGAMADNEEDFGKEFKLFNVELSGNRKLLFEQKKKNSEKNNCSQLETIVDYIGAYCKEESIERLPSICMPPLAEKIDISDSSKDYSIDSVPIGIYDDPDSQYQGEVCFNFCENNTMIIGASATGKTNLLQTIIRQITGRFSPREASIYIMDFGSMYLKNFEQLQHVGGVVTLSEEEKLRNLFKLLMEEIQNRKEKFLNMGISSFTAYRESGAKEFPQIFLMIDNLNVFREAFGESLEDNFIYIIREGIAYGISVIVTNSQVARLGYKYMSNFSSRIAFHSNDSSEYSSLFERCRMQPKDIPGRALCKIDKEIYELQVYLAFRGAKEIERSKAVKAFVDDVNAEYPLQHTKMIPEIPSVLDYTYIEENFNYKKQQYLYPVALDYATVDVVALDFKQINELCIVGNEQQKRIGALTSILRSIEHNYRAQNVKTYIIDNVERPLKSKGDAEYVETYTIDYMAVGEIIENIAEEFERRYELLINEGMEAVSELPLYLIIVNSKDAIEYISTTKNVLEIYNILIKKYRALGICFVYPDIEDAAVAYGAPELMKRFKESKKVLITTPNLKEFKFCEVPSNFARTSKQLKNGDAYLLNGTAIQRVKLINM